MSFDVELILRYFCIFLPLMTFVLGIKLQNYRIKNNHIREKARELDEGIMKDLKACANEVKKQISDKDYIFVWGKIPVGLKLNNCEFAESLEKSKIFKVKDSKISLVYRKDGILRKHAKIIIQNLETYYTELSQLKNMIENFNESNIPLDFEENFRNLLKNEFVGDCLENENRLNEFLFISYMISISGSKNSYTSGRTCIIDIIKKRYDDLQSIARKNPESNETFSIIQNRLANIISCQSKLINEIEELHEEWQNKLII